ncbi:hypothetical protein KCU61_g8012, partial [Aureobasidium melanogenum]
HSQLKTGHPVRSAIHKQLNGRLVLRWVTTWESLLLYVLHLYITSFGNDRSIVQRFGAFQECFIINSVLRSAILEKEDEDFENRWSLIQHPDQQAVAKPSIAPAEPFQNGFLDASVVVLQDFVIKRCGENGLGHDNEVHMDWLADDAFGVIDARTAQDNTILFCVREDVDAVQEAEVRLAWNKGMRSDELLSRYIEDAEDIDDQDIMFLVESLAIDKDDATEASVANLGLYKAKQKINDWIDLEQQGGRPRWFEIRMVVENAMRNSYGISNIGPAAVLTEMKDEFDEDGVMRH